MEASWSRGSFNEDKFSKAILLYRNAPRMGGFSPAQLVFNHPVRDCLPAHHRSFTPEWQKSLIKLERTMMNARKKQAENFNHTAHTLPLLDIGQHVAIQHLITKRWSTPGVIVEVGANRDYLIKTTAGRLFRRNRRFLRHLIPTMPTGAVANDPPLNPPLTTENEPVAGAYQPETGIQPQRKSTRKPQPSTHYPDNEYVKP